MKGKDCCERCEYWDLEEWLSTDETMEYSDCNRFPQLVRKKKMHWCGEFKNNNAHFNKDEDDD